MRTCTPQDPQTAVNARVWTDDPLPGHLLLVGIFFLSELAYCLLALPFNYTAILTRSGGVAVGSV